MSAILIDLPDRQTDRQTDGQTDGQTDRQTDGQTDTVAYRDARTHLKTARNTFEQKSPK